MSRGPDTSKQNVVRKDNRNKINTLIWEARESLRRAQTMMWDDGDYQNASRASEYGIALEKWAERAVSRVDKP